jgi:hypothetical protein
VVTRTPDATAMQQAELIAVGLQALDDPAQTLQNLQSQTLVAIADGDGRFVFRNLPAGAYRLSVRAPGYVIGSFGQARPGGPSRSVEVADDQKLGDVSVKLWKLASIAGTVLDENGEPAVSATVRLLSANTRSAAGDGSPCRTARQPTIAAHSDSDRSRRVATSRSST